MRARSRRETLQSREDSLRGLSAAGSRPREDGKSEIGAFVGPYGPLQGDYPEPIEGKPIRARGVPLVFVGVRADAVRWAIDGELAPLTEKVLVTPQSDSAQVVGPAEIVVRRLAAELE